MAMNRSTPGLDVTFEYEDGPVPRFSMIDAFARILGGMERRPPGEKGGAPFLEAPKVADYLSGAMFVGADVLSHAHLSSRIKRLRAISIDSKPLIEHSYDREGRRRATVYPDNVVVNYEWDDQSRSAKIWSTNGWQTTIKIRPDDRIGSVVYNDQARFEYDYDSRGNLKSVTYPDGVRLQRSFGADGRIANVVCGAARIAYLWSPEGVLQEFAVTHGSKQAIFSGNKQRFEFTLTPHRTPDQPSSITANPFGVWQFDAEGMLNKVLAPWGERLACARFQQGVQLEQTGLRGLRRFSLSHQHVLQESIAENGERFYFHTLPESDVLLVASDSVALLEYDHHGRLIRLRGSGGHCCSYKWTSLGQVRRVESAIGKTKLAYDHEGRIRSAKLPMGCECSFDFDDDGKLNNVIAKGRRGLCAVFSRAVTEFCWSWLAMRSTLRLETEAQ
jgi:YD repeat-containing protein